MDLVFFFVLIGFSLGRPMVRWGGFSQTSFTYELPAYFLFVRREIVVKLPAVLR